MWPWLMIFVGVLLIVGGLVARQRMMREYRAQVEEHEALEAARERGEKVEPWRPTPRRVTEERAADERASDEQPRDQWSTEGRSSEDREADRWSSDSGSSHAGSSDTGSYNTGSYATGSYGAGSSDTGSSDTGSSDTGSYTTGSYTTGSSDTGSYERLDDQWSSETRGSDASTTSETSHSWDERSATDTTSPAAGIPTNGPSTGEYPRWSDTPSQPEPSPSPRPETTPTPAPSGPVAFADRPPTYRLTQPPMLRARASDVPLLDWLRYYSDGNAWSGVIQSISDRVAGDPTLRPWFGHMDQATLQRHVMATVMDLAGEGLTVGMVRRLADAHLRFVTTGGEPVTTEAWDKLTLTAQNALREHLVPETAVLGLVDTIAPLKSVIVTRSH